MLEDQLVRPSFPIPDITALLHSIFVTLANVAVRLRSANLVFPH